MPSTLNDITNIILVSPELNITQNNDIMEKLLVKHNIICNRVVNVKDLYPILADSDMIVDGIRIDLDYLYNSETDDPWNIIHTIDTMIDMIIIDIINCLGADRP